MIDRFEIDDHNTVEAKGKELKYLDQKGNFI